MNKFQEIYNKINSSGYVTPEFPELIDIEVTSKCNYKCLMCNHTYMKRKQEDMDDIVWNSILSECSLYKPGVRLIENSEPFLVKDIINKCQQVKNLGLLLHITTNGSLITHKQIDELIGIGLDSIIFSFQGASEKEYSFIRGKDNFKLVYEKIGYFYLNRKNTHIQVTTTVTDRDKEWEINWFKQFMSGVCDKVSVGKTSFRHIERKYPGVYECLGIDKPPTTPHKPCQGINSHMHIHSNGDVVPCSHDIEGIMSFGNVLDNSLKSIWNNGIYNSTRYLLREMRMDTFDICKDCIPAYDFTTRGK